MNRLGEFGGLARKLNVLAVKESTIFSAPELAELFTGQQFLDHARRLREDRTIGSPGVYVFSEGYLCRGASELLSHPLKWTSDPQAECHKFLAGHGKFTIRLTRIHELSERVDSLRSSVDAFCGGSSAVNAYYSPPGSGRAIPPHRDPGVQVIFQLDGEKLWHLPTEKRTLILTKGDILVLPLAMEHCAETVESYSLHLTMMVNPIPELRVLEFLRSVVESA